MNSRRDAPNLSEPIELLIIDKNAADPIPNPPHPSTLKCPGLIKPTRTMRPFIQHYTAAASKNKSPLMNKIIGPLETMGVVSDTTALGVNLWQGWFRVPKKGESWELRRERIEGIQEMKGDFHRVNITYVSTSGSAHGMYPFTAPSTGCVGMLLRNPGVPRCSPSRETEISTSTAHGKLPKLVFISTNGGYGNGNPIRNLFLGSKLLMDPMKRLRWVRYGEAKLRRIKGIGPN